MDTGSLVQPGRQFTLSEIAEELGGVLEVPPIPVMTAENTEVYHGIWTNPQGEQVEVAVKELKRLIPKDRQTDPEQLNRKVDTRLKREVFVWSQTTHPNLHPLLGYRLQPRPRLVSPWCRHGNLKDYLQANPGLSRGDKLRLIFQTACGLEHLHAQTPPICHADVKPENVLMNDFQGPTLSDFGLSRVLQDLDEPSGFSTSETVKGTLRYKAAELFAGQKPSLESDVYAFGGLILTVMSGKAPFYGLDQLVVMRRVMQDQPPRPVHHRALPAEDPVWTLMRRCWANRPPARPTMREVLLELLGFTLNEESGPPSRLSLPSRAEDCSEAFSNTDIDVPGAPKQSFIHRATSNPDVAECTSSGIPHTADTQTPTPEDISTVAREELKRLQLRSNVFPVIGKYISAVVEVGLNLVEIIQHMDRSRNASKCLELSILKLVTLIQSVDERLRQHEGDEVPNLVGDMQRELQCVRGKLEELRSTELFGDASMKHDQADSMKYQRTTSMVLEEVELLVDLNTTYLLTQLEDTDAQDQRRKLLNCLGDGKDGARGNAIEDVICLPGTRVEILNRIDDWIRDTSAKSRVLWIRGMAGRGKSTIASTVIHNWQYRASCALFHFRRGQNTLDGRIVCALAKQLGNSLVPEVRDAILESVRQNGDIADQRLSAQFETLLIAPLSTLKHQSHTILFVVDALDECEHSKDAEDLVKLIDLHSSSLPINVKFLLTCRPEAALVRTLEPRGWHVENLDSSPDVTNDIARFFEQAFLQIRENHSLVQDWPSRSDVNRLVEMSQGLFQWARTAIAYIGNRSPTIRLNDLLKRPSLWSDLDDLYHQILARAVDNIGLDPSRRELLCDVLGSLVVAPYPVSLEVIISLCWKESYSIFEVVHLEDIMQFLREDILVDLHSLLLIPTSSSQPLCLIHNSIRDLLVSERRCKGQAYYIEITQHHERLASVCLHLMLQCMKNVCHLPDLPKANWEIQDIGDQEVPTTIRYCCRAWSIHLTEGTQWSRLRTDGQSSLRLDFEIFTKQGVLCWLEVMSESEATDEAMDTARRMHKWLLESPPELSEPDLFCNLWNDTQRFIAAFWEPISSEPFHIYVSALPHCPQKTTLWEWYGKHAKIQAVCGLQSSVWPYNLWTRQTYPEVNAVAFSPDGSALASGSYGSSISLWDTQTGALVDEFDMTEYCDDHILSVTFSPDGKVLVFGTGHEENMIHLWDPLTGSSLGEPLTGHLGSVYSVVFSPDGKFLASGSKDRTIRLWDPEARTPLGEPLTGHDGKVNCVAFSPDGKVLASGSEDCTIRLWNARTGTLLAEPLIGHDGEINCVAFSPDVNVLASGSCDRTIRLWDLQTAMHLDAPFMCHNREVFAIDFSHDGKVLASGSADDTIQLWDPYTKMPLGAPLIGHLDRVCSVAFSPEDKALASGSHDGTVRLWDLRTAMALDVPATGNDEQILSIDSPPDGNVMAPKSDEPKTRPQDLQTGTPVGEWLMGLDDSVQSVAFSPDGKVLASGYDDCTIQLWDAQTWQRLGEPLVGHDAGVSSVTFSPYGKILASGSNDHTIQLWDAQTGAPLGEPLTGHDGSVDCVAFSPDGKVLASGSWDCTIRLWDAQTGTPLGEPLTGHNKEVDCIAFSPGGKVLASGSMDGLRLWDAQTGTSRGEPLVCRSDPWITTLAFSPDGKILATKTGLGIINLWDTRTWNPLPEPAEDDISMVFLAPLSGAVLQAPQTIPCSFLEFRDGWLSTLSSRLLWLPPQYWAIVHPYILLSNRSLVIVSDQRLSIFNVSGLL